MRQELAAREEARNNVKLVWRALAAMASGLYALSLLNECLAASTALVLKHSARLQALLHLRSPHSPFTLNSQAERCCCMELQPGNT